MAPDVTRAQLVDPFRITDVQFVGGKVVLSNPSASGNVDTTGCMVYELGVAGGVDAAGGSNVKPLAPAGADPIFGVVALSRATM